MTPRKLLLATLVTALFTTTAHARPRPGGQLGERSFEANKTFGVGLELGSPTGLIGKWFLSESGALDFGFGTVFGTSGRSGAFHIYGDYLFHPISLASHAEFELPLYIGVGGRFWHFDQRFAPFDVELSASVVGVRVPVGIAFDFNSVPLDAFVQLVPTLDYYSYSSSSFGDMFGNNGFDLDFDASIGVRYWFD
jgi:hypothetical protein